MIQTTITDTCLELAIVRPERRNAITDDMFAQLDKALRSAQDNPACHAVIISGSEGHFSSGNELTEFQTPRGSGDSPAVAFLRTLASTDIPVIAAVEGHAVGVGVTLLQHCDFVYASETANFSLPFLSLGLCPEGASSLLLSRIVGPRRAARWLLLGRPFDAKEAFESGFITALVSRGQALAMARACATALAAQPNDAVRASKRLMRAHGRDEMMRAIDTERDAFNARLRSPEAQSAIKRFFDKQEA